MRQVRSLPIGYRRMEFHLERVSQSKNPVPQSWSFDAQYLLVSTVSATSLRSVLPKSTKVSGVLSISNQHGT